MRKKILFIIPYIPYPLDSGGNQAFFNMVEYLRHKMSVSAHYPWLKCHEWLYEWFPGEMMRWRSAYRSTR